MSTEPVTKSKKGTAEEATLESEQRYKRLLASVTDYVYAVRVEDGRAVSTFHGPGCEAENRSWPPKARTATIEHNSWGSNIRKYPLAPQALSHVRRT